MGQRSAALHAGAFAGRGLIAAGDFNEILTDDPDGETWAQEYAAKIEDTGLQDLLLKRWGNKPTRFPPDGSPALQLDHVLVDQVGWHLVSTGNPPWRDERWESVAAGEVAPELSDHAPIWFHLQLTRLSGS